MAIQYGEDPVNQRRYVLNVLNSAKKELTEKGRITEELKDGLRRLQEDSPPSDAQHQLKEFMDTVPLVERMNMIRTEITERHKGEATARLERGE